jgi:hypothetical protein
MGNFVEAKPASGVVNGFVLVQKLKSRQLVACGTSIVSLRRKLGLLATLQTKIKED